MNKISRRSRVAYVEKVDFLEQPLLMVLELPDHRRWFCARAVARKYK